MPAELDAWLELTKEDALDPGLPICDPHHHLWDKPGDRYMIDEVTTLPAIADSMTGVKTQIF